MIRVATLALTLSMTMGAAAPLLCDLGCFSEATHRHVQPCHDATPGAGLSAATASCVHAVPDAMVASAKVTPSHQPDSTLLTGATLPSRAPSLQTAHASSAPGLTVHPRSVSRSVLRI